MNRKKKRGKYIFGHIWSFKKSFKVDYLLRKQFKKEKHLFDTTEPR